jgi:5-methylcytosine-specific restriction endonuclease McrA
LAAACKRCVIAQVLRHQTANRDDHLSRCRDYRAKNLETAREKDLKYNEAHREERRLYAQRYREENPEKVIANNRRHYAEHADELRKYALEWAKAHPEQRRLSKHRRRAAVFGNGGTHTAEDIRSQYKRQKGRCFWCHEKVTDYHVDHVVPLVLGGSNGPENLVIACPPCNRSKSGKHPMDACGRLF